MHQTYFDGHQLLLNIACVILICLVGWFFIKHPKGLELSANARCERDFYLLLYAIVNAKDMKQLRYLEEQVIDFYNEYGGKALRAEEYKVDLLSLIAQMQCI